jgi:uncharacterized protein with PIN domain
MFLDASAIIAIIARESDAASLTARLGQAARVMTSPVVAKQSRHSTVSAKAAIPPRSTWATVSPMPAP